MKKLIALSLLCAAVMGVSARAQTQETAALLGDTVNYGSIEGTVIETEDKEPLPGTVIYLMGTKLGANTNIDGYYKIDHVPNGNYIVKAKMMGYQSAVALNQGIESNTTRICDFRLKVIVMPDSDIDLGCPAPMIDVDRTSSSHVWKSWEINHLPGH